MRMFGFWLMGLSVIVALLGAQDLRADGVDIKSFMRKVASGTLVVNSEDIGDELSPYFAGFQLIRQYEDDDVFLAIGRNDQDLILYSWLKGNRPLTLDEVTSRWVEDVLGHVNTEQEMAEFKNFRILLRGAVFDVKENRKSLEAIAFVDDSAVIGPADASSHLQPIPVVYRFKKISHPSELKI